MDSMRFPDLVADVEIDEAVFAREMANRAPADRSYIIMFTPRSGSSWLTSVLSGSKILGRPEEYVNEGFVRDIAKATNSRDAAGMLAILKRRRKSDNGVFGIEATSTQIALFGEAEFFGAFDASTVVFHLWRDNIVAQGISLYRAVATQRFHSSDPHKGAPLYYAAEIRRWIGHLCRIENENRLMLDRHGCFPRVIRYEDIVRSQATTIAMFADALRVDAPVEAEAAEPPETLHKVSDHWNRYVERMFRDQERCFVQDTESQRLIRAG